MCISLSFCLVSIRSSWRFRRRLRFSGKRTHSNEAIGTQRDTETSSVYRNIQRSDECHNHATPYLIPERPMSQRRREREPPVVIGDPTDPNVFIQGSLRRSYSRTSGRVEYTPQITTPKSSRRSLPGLDDIPTRNSLDLRTIPMIPQEDDSDDILSTPSPRYSQSRPRSHPPTHPPVDTVFHP